MQQQLHPLLVGPQMPQEPQMLQLPLQEHLCSCLSAAMHPQAAGTWLESQGAVQALLVLTSKGHP